MTKYWFTSDTHFGHENIIKYANRPFKNAGHMDEELIKRWNSRVKPEDVVFHLGDFGFVGSDIKKIMSRLNGTIIWIKGNHDKKTNIHSMWIEISGDKWFLIHDPDYAEGKYNLCGHVHDEWMVMIDKNDNIIVNVGVDQWDYYPINIVDIKAAVSTKAIEKKWTADGGEFSNDFLDTWFNLIRDVTNNKKKTKRVVKEIDQVKIIANTTYGAIGTRTTYFKPMSIEGKQNICVNCGKDHDEHIEELISETVRHMMCPVKARQ